jgi:hypothetical protein
MTDPRGLAEPRADGHPIERVVIHPPFDKAFVTSEHPEGQLEWLGDALGTDFIIVRFVRGWARMHDSSGERNEDWFGWNAAVLAPFDGHIVHVMLPTGTNSPGHHEGGPAGGIVFARADGVHVAYGHIDEICVCPGESVRAGQVVARLSNNGTSWMPHLHVGAWRDEAPLQVCVDLEIMGRHFREQGEPTYYGIASDSE